MEKFNPESENKLEQELNFDGAISWEELYDALDLAGGVQGSRDFYSAEELKSTIEAVRSGTLAPDSITRTGGLREKVKELIKKEAD